MDKQRTRRLILVAFALSLLIHIVLAFNVHWRWVTPVEETHVVKLQIVKPIRVARIVPTPPPTPQPTPRPAVSAPPLPRHSAGPGPSEGGGSNGRSRSPQPSPTPTPPSSPAPDCHRLDIPAQIAASPPPPDLTPEARAATVSGTARVRVQLGADGSVTGTTIVNSSGSGTFDDVAVGLARAARYTPATHECKTVASYYDFTAKFSPW